MPKTAKYMPYPEPDDRRSGCKVSWYYYDDRAKAEECAKAARFNAVIAADLGYDFGFCSPGSISKHGFDKKGQWEVCLP